MTYMTDDQLVGRIFRIIRVAYKTKVITIHGEFIPSGMNFSHDFLFVGGPATAVGQMTLPAVVKLVRKGAHIHLVLISKENSKS